MSWSESEAAPRAASARPLVGAWALAGVAALFLEAIYNLGRRGIATVQAGLAPLEWAVLLLLTGAFVYGEGVRALQRKWVPRVLGRCAAVARERAWWLRLLAPLYAMGLVGGTAGTRFRASLGVAAVVVAVLVVRSLPEPWRGIIDLAVAAALLWGLVALLHGGVRRARRVRQGATS